jgi:hypothetical protein
VKYGPLCPRQLPVRDSTFNFLFVRAHASAVTNQTVKMNEEKEVLAKLRFNKHKNSGDQLPSQNSCAVGGTVDSNSRGLMWTGMSVLVLGLFRF